MNTRINVFVGMAAVAVLSTIMAAASQAFAAVSPVLTPQGPESCRQYLPLEQPLSNSVVVQCQTRP